MCCVFNLESPCMNVSLMIQINLFFFFHFMAQKEDWMKEDVTLFVPFRVLSFEKTHWFLACVFRIISSFVFATC